MRRPMQTPFRTPLRWARPLAGALFALLLMGQAAAEPKVIKRVLPEFPADATRRNINDGTIRARLTIDGQGSVTEVQIVEAQPASASVFKEAAVAALTKWRFEPSGKAQNFDIKLVFAQE